MAYMSIKKALLALLEPDGGEGPGPGVPQVAPLPSPAAGVPPLGPVLEALQVRVADLEAKMNGVKTYVDTEVDGARRQVERVRSAQRRIEAFLEGGDGEPDAAADVSGGDASAGQRGGVLPMHGSVEGPAPTSPEAIRAAARRALSGMS